MTLIHNPPNEIALIDTLWAFVSVDEHGREGVCAIVLPYLGTTPMVTAQERLLPKMKTEARRLAHETGRVVRLIRLTERTELEVFEPV